MFGTHDLSRLRLTFGRGRSEFEINKLPTSSLLWSIPPSPILFDQSLSRAREWRGTSRQAKFLFYLFIYVFSLTNLFNHSNTYMTQTYITYHSIPFSAGLHFSRSNEFPVEQ